MTELLSSLSLAQWLATFLSLAYIYFAVKNKSIAFVFGLFSCAIWAYEDFVNLNLKFDGVLQLFYVAMSIYGIYSWRFGGEQKTERPITKLSKFQNYKFILLGIIVSVFWGYIGANYFDTELPYLDAITTGFSIIATVLLVYRYVDNWIYWMIINPIYIYIYWRSEAYLFMGIMLVFTIMAVVGFQNWKKEIPEHTLKFSPFIFLIPFFVLLLPSGKDQIDPLSFPAYEGPSISYLLLDGLDQGHFKKLLNQNKLPNIQKLKEEGLYVENGIGSFPSMTGYAFYPFITGHDASKSGVLGLRWFDRSRGKGQFRNYVGRSNIHMNQDLNNKYETLYQKFDSFYTCSINSYMTKGVKEEVKTGWALTTSKYQDLKLFKFIRSIPYFGGRWTYSFKEHESMVCNIAIDQLIYNPPVQWVTFACPDTYAHIYGMDQNYDEIVIHIDSLIGQFVNKAKALGQERNIAIITDHGLENVHKNIHVCEEVNNEIGLQLKRGDSTNLLFSSLDKDATDERLDGYFVINGNLSAYIYLQSQGTYKQKLLEKDLRNYRLLHDNSKVDLIDYFAKVDYLEMIMYQIDDHTIGISDKSGEAKIIESEGQFKYEPLSSDVFRYSNISDSLLLSGYHSREEWLSLTAESDYPYAVCRAHDLVINSTSGDLVLCSSPETDLAKDYEMLGVNYKGGHGGIRASMLRVPYILCGPKVPIQVIHSATAEDFGGKIFDILAKK